MEFEDSTAEASFRAEVRAWLDAHARRRPAGDHVGLFVDEGELGGDVVRRAREWQRALADDGWAAVHWPREYGGRDASLVEKMIFDEEVACYDVPAQVATIGLAMIGPTLIAHGTDDHKARYLPRMLRGDDIWCQLWSEPGAGSDLASLATRAELDGDGYVLNGQKVWTSGAHYSDLGLGIFRSDADAPKHRGISCLIVDMRTPGITVRPLRQMTGGANFNEVFFDDVRVPAANLVGARHDGWRVALTVLMNERFASGGLSRASQVFPLLAALARTTGGGDVDAVCRQRLAEVYSLGRIFELTNARVRSALASGALPGPEGSILKLAVAELGTRQAAAALAVLGGSGMLSGNDSPEGGRWQSAFLAAPAVHIGGGTDEVQRNIIGEKVLGLPKEPAA